MTSVASQGFRGAGGLTRRARLNALTRQMSPPRPATVRDQAHGEPDAGCSAES